MQTIISNLLERGIIVNSFSAFGSPALLVSKPDELDKGKTRLCVNYKEINNATIDMKYNFPKITNMIDKLRNKKYFTKLDIANGFWHIPVAESDRNKLAFYALNGHYEWTVMPFGYKNAPSIFQYAIYSKLVKNNLTPFSQNYMDDIIISSDDIDTHYLQVEKTLKAFENENIILKASKCEFAVIETEYLGQIISHNFVRPKNSNVKAIEQLPIPSTKKKLKQFLGKINFYRRFMPNASSLLSPLYELTGEKTKFKIEKEHIDIINLVKSYLISAPVLAQFDQNLDCYLFTDASKKGIGGILKQYQSNKELHPIGYFSRKLNKSEQNYFATELELLAIVDSVKYWYYYLINKKFTVITDHESLKYLKTFKEHNPRLVKWNVILSPFNFDVVYRKGKLNLEADYLSRNFIDSSFSVNEIKINLISIEEIKDKQNELDLNLIHLPDYEIYND